MRITDRYGDWVETSTPDKDGFVHLTARDVHDGNTVEVELTDKDRKALRKALKRCKTS